MAALREKHRAIPAGQVDRQTLNIGTNWDRVEGRLRAWRSEKFAHRLWAKDPTLWSSEPVPELADRLGWLILPEAMYEQLDDLTAFGETAKAEGVCHVVLLGMGGSSLTPEVFQRIFGNAPRHPELIVLDSTHPAAVRAVEARIDLRHTLFLVSSKSGTTVETLSFFRYFWRQVSQAIDTPGRHFVAITDPGTPLEQLARERDFRRTFQAPPNVGGRYSALTVFGLVPAVLIGMDVRGLLDRARTMAEVCAPCVPEPENPSIALGAALGELALAGRDKVTFLTSRSLEAFPAWLEQLIAESTGKDGKGIVPVAHEPLGSLEVYGEDRFFVHLYLEGDEDVGAEASGHPAAHIRLREKADIGQEIFRWEVAVAAAGAVLGVHPFNQPDVQLAKELARRAMERGSEGVEEGRDEGPEMASATRPEELAQAIGSWLAQARAGDYVALQAYLAPTPETTAILQEVRLVLRDRLRLATTLGYGPRFLHSTGQLHKGGPDTGLFLQLVDEPADDLPVPETSYTFGALIRAQALGDYQALKRLGRRVLRVYTGVDSARGLEQLAKALCRVLC
ncbi:MAG TPA: hypothetical protein EYP17_00710 [Candidatus Latescibacteria bacterium]|nr:hypothetical protein [Candidatus Latescibacterota bacterium]